MRLTTLAFLLLLGTGLCQAAQPPPAASEGEQWVRQYLTDLGEKTQAHRTYLQILFSVAILGAGVLGVLIARWSWRNRQDIKELREISLQQLESAAADREALTSTVRFVLASTLTKYEYFHLKQLAESQAHLVKFSDALTHDVRHLEALDFITGTGKEPGYRALFRIIKERSRSPAEFDLKQLFQVTERGSDYLRQRGLYAEEDA